MKTNNKIKKELVSQLSKNSGKIVFAWASQIMKVAGHKKYEVLTPVTVHKIAMARYFKFLIAFLNNQHDTACMRCMTTYIQEGHLSVNTAEDIIHGQMLLRKIIFEFLARKYKHDSLKLYKMLELVASAIDVNVLHISNACKKKDFSRLHTLFKAGSKFIGAKDLNRLLGLALKVAVKESKADRASIMLMDKEGTLRINVSMGIPDNIVKKSEELIGKSIAGKVAKTNTPIIVNEDTKVGAEIKRYLKGLKVVSAVSIPIAVESSEVLGVLNLSKYKDKAPFDKEDVELLSILAYETATSIKSYQLLLEAEGLYIGTIFALAAALDARDHYTHGHSKKVAKDAVAIAKALNLPSHQVEIVRRASLLHDIGKIGVPDKILNKPGRLTKEEFRVVKKHPEVALKILKPIPQIKDLLPAIYHEHERFDGKGYVVGLKGEAIPLEARIIGVADAYDAMTSERPYRKPLSKKEAVKELKKCAGTQFDPKVVKAFVSILGR